MPVITVSFYDGETGEKLDVPKDFALRLFPPGSDQLQAVRTVVDSGPKFVAVTESGIFTAHFGSESKIVSLDPEIPSDVSLLVLDGEDSRASFDAYIWDLQPDQKTALPSESVHVRVTCAYCDNRYMTPGSPYYHNLTWYKNCYTNPPCTY